MECYDFCQRYKDHFAMTEANGLTCIFFAVLFLRNRAFFYWQKYKYKLEGKIIALII